jgi:tetratricopeptide (TPR) repeat protein
MRRLFVLAAAAGIFWLSCRSTGRAEPALRADTQLESPGYKSAVETAIAEFDQGNFAEAREQFQRAHALFPNARTLRGIGMSDFELRKYVDALDNLERALASDVKRLEGKLRDDTIQLRQRAQAYVGTVKLHRQLGADDSVTVDDFNTQIGPDGVLHLVVGDHVIELRREGRLVERQAFALRGEQTLDLFLAPRESAPDASEERTSTSPAKSEREPVYKKWWLWTTVGVVVAAGAVSAAVLLSRDKSSSDEPFSTAHTPVNGTFQPLWRY